jgi:hypothetical protein
MKEVFMAESNSFTMAQKQVDIVRPYLEADEGLLEKLKSNKRELIVHFPVKPPCPAFGGVAPRNMKIELRKR